MKKWIEQNEKDIMQTTELEYNPLISVVIRGIQCSGQYAD